MTEQERIDADYAYFKSLLADRQAESDAMSDRFDFPRTDLAWQAAMKLATSRACNRLNWAAAKARYDEALRL
jgi:hypothetical protein